MSNYLFNNSVLSVEMVVTSLQDLNHRARALAPVKWKMLHFYGKSIMFVFTPTAITMSLISHSLHFHVWEGETG